jgi:YD repeat-containing protein
VIPLDLDKLASAGNSQLSVHNASGIVFTPDGSYAFITGRADQVNSAFGGGFNGVGLNAGGVSGFLDQTANPLYTDGNVGIIKDPLGPNPQLVAATRPIPFGFPEDLALSADGHYLYVSYQGLPLDTGTGGVLVFDAQAMIQQVQSALQSQPSGSLMRKVAIDDLPLNSNNQRQENPLIDVRADYLLHTENGQAVFGIPAGSMRPPVLTGGFPGGIAVQKGPIPTPMVLTPVAPGSNGSSATPGFVETNEFTIDTEVDPATGQVYPGSSAFDFTLGVKDPKVSLTIDGKPLKNITITDAQGNTQTFASSDNMELDAANKNDVFRSVLTLNNDPNNPLNKRGKHTYTLRVETPDGRVAEKTGEVVNEVVTYEGLPVGHTFVKGVDLADGHLVVSSQDIQIPGRGLSLQFTRTYTSAGDNSFGPLGAGWTDNYNIFLIQQGGDAITVVGGDGGGDTFKSPALDAAKAGLFGLNPSTAKFWKPSAGYHDTLVQADPTKPEYDLYTKDGNRYHFKLAGSETGQPQHGLSPESGSIFQLRYIQDPNGNTINLYYSTKDTGNAASLSGALLNKVDDDFTTLDVVTDTSGRGLVFTYDKIAKANRITRIVGYDPNGSALDGLSVTYTYDKGAGDLTSVYRENNVQGALSTPSIETYTYTSAADPSQHNLLSYTDPNGNTTTYQYYPTTAQLQIIAFPNNISSSLVSFLKIPGSERVAKVIEPDGVAGAGSGTAITSFDFDVSAHSVVVTDANGNAATYQADNSGRVTDVTGPLGKTMHSTWVTTNSGDIRLQDQTDSLGQKVNFEYDNNGNVTKQTTTFATASPILPFSGPNQAVTVYTYDPRYNKVRTVTDAVENTTTYDYDSHGNLLAQTDAFGDKTTYQYDSQGQLLVVTDPNGGTTSYTYDVFGNAATVTDAVGNVTTNTFDVRSRLLDSSDTFGHHIKYTYDGLNRITSRTADANASEKQVVTYTYLAGGQVASETDGLGHTTKYSYDQANRVVSRAEENVKRADGGIEDSSVLTTTYKYDHDGNLTSELDPGHISQIYQYDALNRQIKTTLVHPDGSSERIDEKTYDLAGNVLTDTDLHGDTTAFGYDGLYRLVQTQLPSSIGHVLSYGYDLLGHKTLETDANGVQTTYAYDKAYRLTTVISAAQSLKSQVAYGYDKNGNRTSEVDSTGGATSYSVDYTYDLLNRLTQQVQHVSHLAAGATANYTTSWVYNDNANAVVITDPRGIKTAEFKDFLDRIVSRTVDQGGLNLETDYTYDANGNLATLKDPQNGDIDETYTYDGLNRLMRIQYAAAAGDRGLVQEIFLYDNGANRVVHTDRNGVVFTTTYDGLQRVLSVTAGGTTLTSYTYDDLHNIVSTTDANGKVSAKQYDALGQLIKTTDALGQTVEDTYDGVNKIREVNEHGDTTTYSYDDLHRLTLQQDGPGAQVQTSIRYDYDDHASQVTTTDRNNNQTVAQYDSLGRLSSTTRGNATTTFEYDGDGNLLRLTDPNGNVTQYVYDRAGRRTDTTVGSGSDAGTTHLT